MGKLAAMIAIALIALALLPAGFAANQPAICTSLQPTYLTILVEPAALPQVKASVFLFNSTKNSSGWVVDTPVPDGRILVIRNETPGEVCQIATDSQGRAWAEIVASNAACIPIRAVYCPSDKIADQKTCTGLELTGVPDCARASKPGSAAIDSANLRASQATGEYCPDLRNPPNVAFCSIIGLLFGLLFAAAFAQGRNPLHFFDLGAARGIRTSKAGMYTPMSRNVSFNLGQAVDMAGAMVLTGTDAAKLTKHTSEDKEEVKDKNGNVVRDRNTNAVVTKPKTDKNGNVMIKEGGFGSRFKDVAQGKGLFTAGTRALGTAVGSLGGNLLVGTVNLVGGGKKEQYEKDDFGKEIKTDKNGKPIEPKMAGLGDRLSSTVIGQGVVTMAGQAGNLALMAGIFGRKNFGRIMGQGLAKIGIGGAINILTTYTGELIDRWTANSARETKEYSKVENEKGKTATADDLKAGGTIVISGEKGEAAGAMQARLEQARSQINEALPEGMKIKPGEKLSGEQMLYLAEHGKAWLTAQYRGLEREPDKVGGERVEIINATGVTVERINAKGENEKIAMVIILGKDGKYYAAEVSKDGKTIGKMTSNPTHAVDMKIDAIVAQKKPLIEQLGTIYDAENKKKELDPLIKAIEAKGEKATEQEKLELVSMRKEKNEAELQISAIERQIAPKAKLEQTLGSCNGQLAMLKQEKEELNGGYRKIYNDIKIAQTLSYMEKHDPEGFRLLVEKVAGYENAKKQFESQSPGQSLEKISAIQARMDNALNQINQELPDGMKLEPGGEMNERQILHLEQKGRTDLTTQYRVLEQEAMSAAENLNTDSGKNLIKASADLAMTANALNHNFTHSEAEIAKLRRDYGDNTNYFSQIGVGNLGIPGSGGDVEGDKGMVSLKANSTADPHWANQNIYEPLMQGRQPVVSGDSPQEVSTNGQRMTQEVVNGAGSIAGIISSGQYGIRAETLQPQLVPAEGFKAETGGVKVAAVDRKTIDANATAAGQAMRAADASTNDAEEPKYISSMGGMQGAASVNTTGQTVAYMLNLAAHTYFDKLDPLKFGWQEKQLFGKNGTGLNADSWAAALAVGTLKAAGPGAYESGKYGAEQAGQAAAWSNMQQAMQLANQQMLRRIQTGQ